MQKTKKSSRILAVFLSLVMLLGLLPTITLPAQAFRAKKNKGEILKRGAGMSGFISAPKSARCISISALGNDAGVRHT